MLKKYYGTVEIQWSACLRADPHRQAPLGQQENTAQDAQKGQTSHPPNPGSHFTRPP